MEKLNEIERTLSALKNASLLTVLFLTARLASDEQIQQIAAALNSAANHIESAASNGSDWPCDLSFVREIARTLEGTATLPSWVPEVIEGGKSEYISSKGSRSPQ